MRRMHLGMVATMQHNLVAFVVSNMIVLYTLLLWSHLSLHKVELDSIIWDYDGPSQRGPGQGSSFVDL